MKISLDCAGELSSSPSRDKSRARLGESLTLEDLEISTPEEHAHMEYLATAEEDRSWTMLNRYGAEEEDGSPWRFPSSHPIPTPNSSEGSSNSAGSSGAGPFEVGTF